MKNGANAIPDLEFLLGTVEYKLELLITGLVPMQ